MWIEFKDLVYNGYHKDTCLNSNLMAMNEYSVNIKRLGVLIDHYKYYKCEFRKTMYFLDDKFYNHFFFCLKLYIL